ncbi:patatin-like phospholipase family protein [Phenylobacterium sp.]|uniref:patatin-like phospholipase family protein n=1 Tax=Phenylobacterium sp. TaxID=1871053 RepID=UPI0025D7F608|nr:patatin-like phospholipase family protein [Phenylobacterium sp.]
MAAELKECDLVMKGGITSGVVYPYAILELAGSYRFRSIGGASAGAIAAAFAAAGEYARQTGDKDAFVRFEDRINDLPQKLASLFQPDPPFELVMKAALAATGDKTGRRGRVLRALGLPLRVGAGVGVFAFFLLTALPLAFAWSWGAGLIWLVGALLAASIGAVVVLGRHLAKVIIHDLPAHDFGLCSGMRPDGSTQEALTEWIYDSLQIIAFGPAGRTQPLTFRDLAEVGLMPDAIKRGEKAIQLEMMVTNLSLGRPHAVPHFGLKLLFSPKEWAKLFPDAVLGWLLDDARCPALPNPPPETPDLRQAPPDLDLPVVVGVRMSLSFPILIRAVPMHMADVGAAARNELPPKTKPPIRRILFSDGGITSNFPVHFFDRLFPERPTFALSLDALHSPTAPLISMPQAPADGAFSPIRSFEGVGGFVGAILGAAKDWQDEMMSVMPGQRQRVVRIRLDKDEGGLNLNMPVELSEELMARGGEAGREICTSFNFDEHRYRRTVVAYEHLADLVRDFAAAWPQYSKWYRHYSPGAKSYDDMIPRDARVKIADHLDALVAAEKAFTPAQRRSVKFPRPKGRLRIVPDL